MNTSDRNGRALEYAITLTILNNLNSKCKLSEKAVNHQNRDKEKFTSLSPSMQNYFLSSSKTIFDWLNQNFQLGQNISIDRLSDNEAKDGDPTDIALLTNNSKINLSIKHNHKATKHQRPNSLLQQLGIKKNSNSDKKYRDTQKKISNIFYKKYSYFSNFNSIKSQFPSSIDNDLYDPVCSEVVKELNKYKFSNTNVEKFFDFLVGKVKFYKIIVDQKKIEILDFTKIIKPSSFSINQIDKKYINLKFDNDWEFKMRLHTASSRLEGCNKKGCSLKFDTNLINDPIESIILYFN